MDDPSLARALVDAVISDFPDHEPGTRPIHTIGIGVEGYFEASDVARSYCIAEHFAAQRVPVSVRFSNGSGSPKQHDGWNDVRGMATRFHLKDGAATDLVAMTLGEFFVPTVKDFFDFTKAAQQTPVAKESPWRKILDMLQLKIPLNDPYAGQRASGDAGTLAYANKHKFAQLSVFQAGSIGAPVSYVRAAYHAVHTFIVTGSDGVRRPVRFSWKPVAGVRNTDPTQPPADSYLQEELRERLKQWPARFLLMMQIGETGDVLDDPTQPWPAHRIRVIMGTLTLTKVAEDQQAAGERISFNPWRLVSGIEPSDDPILHARKGAYEDSRQRRGGTACPFNRS
ncbi:catalase [Bradyrhizobium sp. STM 3562]|uniref:catalase n=1 Tax=Bradyrhizobium sp. STM 3562 TaxID=578924 RepID=UPI00388DF569